jgi:hypothetical protein
VRFVQRIKSDFKPMVTKVKKFVRSNNNYKIIS